jgi:hypothetical protein
MDSYREIRHGAMLLIAMADFWKHEPTDRKAEILDDPTYRELFLEHLIDSAAQDVVWKAGYNFFTGGLHGYKTD